MRFFDHKFKLYGIWFIALILIWVLNDFLPTSVSSYTMDIIVYSGINIILAVSLNLVNGFTGQFSMGHAGFMAVGGYTAAVITMHGKDYFPFVLNIPFGISLLFVIALYVGGFTASLFGYLVGLPSLRLKGDYLAIVTLGFGEIIRVFLLNMDSIGGARGLPGIPTLSSFGWIYTVVLATIFVIWRLVKSSHGRRLLAVREDEIAAESIGVNTTHAKVKAFVIGAFFSGVAGGLYAHYLTFLVPQTFDFNKSFEIIIMVVLGGMGSITGSVFAAVFLTTIKEALRELHAYTQIDLRMVIFSLTLIIVMLTRPHGIFGTKEITHLFSWFKKKQFFNKEVKT